MKVVGVVFSGLLLAACGAAPEDELASQTEQEFAARFACTASTCATFGTRTGTSALSCDRQSTGQVCALPPSKAVRYAVANGTINTTQQDLNQIRADVQSALTALSGAGITFTESTQNPTMVFVVNGGFTPNDVMKCSGGSTSNNMESFVCLSGDVSQGLSESLPGQYVIRQTTFLQIDLTDIFNRATNDTQFVNFRRNVVRNGIVKALGAGGIDNDSTRCSSRKVSTANKLDRLCVFASSEVCRIGSFVQSGSTTSFSEVSGTCGS